MTGRPPLAETSTHGSVLVRGIDVVEETLDSITVASDCSFGAGPSELEHPQKKRDKKAVIRIRKRDIACRLRMRAPCEVLSCRLRESIEIVNSVRIAK